ncbi:rhodanese-like domain-containing protein [Superficieibacter sp.]|uniref:rhodanese-like domain-containing protein n=1 Tax=Superficieibacter sp. TaxID=2303322 RepID=UPI0028AE8E66|nr:rhodanese-like domain-containing protein [Superficieibacter sp.]
MSDVTRYPAASADAAADHFSRRLSFETDCSDVYHAMAQRQQDFVLLHAIGSPQSFARQHIPGALHLPHAEINAQRLAQWPEETLFVVYCAGPHCNGADKAALNIARLGRPVKIMLGGMTGWQDEGFAFNVAPEA